MLLQFCILPYTTVSCWVTTNNKVMQTQLHQRAPGLKTQYTAVGNSFFTSRISWSMSLSGSRIRLISSGVLNSLLISLTKLAPSESSGSQNRERFAAVKHIRVSWYLSTQLRIIRLPCSVLRYLSAYSALTRFPWSESRYFLYCMRRLARRSRFFSLSAIFQI